MEPPLPALPTRAPLILWVDQEFRITLLFAVLEIRYDADQLAIVVIATELSVPFSMAEAGARGIRTTLVWPAELNALDVENVPTTT